MITLRSERGRVLRWVAVPGVRFFRWTGSKHYPEGPRLVRTAEPHGYNGLAPSGPALSFDGKTWEFIEVANA
jgi:hypothetical protein